MSNMMDYMQWRGDLPICPQAPLNEVDLLIFATLVYAPFERLEQPGGPLGSLAAALYPEPPDRQENSYAQDRYRLWQLVPDCPRFARVNLARFRSYLDGESETQFAAALFAVGDTAVVAFRGTDTTLIGWKEDFNMAFESPVPSQLLAGTFLTEAADYGSEQLLVCGHSKGGNLAVYSAVTCPPALQRQLRGVYSFDGPGLSDALLETGSWQAVAGRTHCFIPESSVVGLLLGRYAENVIVRSDSVSIWQHNPFHWHVLGSRLVRGEKTTLSSQFIDGTVDNFLRQCPPEERKTLVNTIFRLLTVSGAERPREIPRALAAHMPEVLAVLQSVPPEERSMLSQALRAMRDSGSDSAKELFDSFRAQDVTQ